MPNSEAVIRDYLTQLGYDPDIARLYIALYTHGPQNLSQLSRYAGIERTRVYRLLDELTNSNLLETETHYKRHIYKAAPISNLRITISRREQQLKNLSDELEKLEETLPANSLRSPASRIQFYQGPEGIRQMLWNQTKAKTEIFCILHENVQSYTGSAFFERWVRKYNERSIRSKGIIGDDFIASQKQWYAHNRNEMLEFWEARYVPAEVFPITYNQVIYNNVVAHYNWRGTEVFGIELYNSEIALTQRHLFKLLWQKASPVSDDGRPN